MTQQFTAVLIDPGYLPSFEGLLDDFPLPMLPVGTKPLIHFWLDALEGLGIKDVLILVEHLPEKLREYIAGGDWGLTVQLANIRHGQAFKTQKVMVDNLQAGHLLIANLNGLPQLDSCIEEMQRGDIVTLGGLDTWAVKYAASIGRGCETLKYAATLIRSPKEYWRINMDLMSGQIKEKNPLGFEADKGVVIGSHCKIGADVRHFAPLILGHNTMVGSGSVIGANALIGEHCVLDEGCYVRNAVVIGRSYIGSQVSIENVVVSGNKAYRVDDGELLRVDDLKTLAKIDGPALVTTVERLVASVLLIVLTVPMCLLALFNRLRGRESLRNHTLYVESGINSDGERRFNALSAFSLDVSNVAWRKVPWLWLVVSKKIKLVGTSPRESADFDYPLWVTNAEEFVPGVINQADFNNIEAGDEESIVVADAFQLAQGQTGLCWPMVAKWLKCLCKF